MKTITKQPKFVEQKNIDFEQQSIPAAAAIYYDMGAETAQQILIEEYEANIAETSKEFDRWKDKNEYMTFWEGETSIVYRKGRATNYTFKEILDLFRKERENAV